MFSPNPLFSRLNYSFQTKRKKCEAGGVRHSCNCGMSASVLPTFNQGCAPAPAESKNPPSRAAEQRTCPETASAPGPKETGAGAPRRDARRRSGEAAAARTAAPVSSSWIESRVRHSRGAPRSPRRDAGEILPSATRVRFWSASEPVEATSHRTHPRPDPSSRENAGPPRPYLAGARRLRGARVSGKPDQRA